MIGGRYILCIGADRQCKRQTCCRCDGSTHLTLQIVDLDVCNAIPFKPIDVEVGVGADVGCIGPRLPNLVAGAASCAVATLVMLKAMAAVRIV